LSDTEWAAQTEKRQSATKYDRGKAERRTLEELKKRNIASLSVFDALHAEVPEEMFYVERGHLAPKGNTVVAGQLMNYIEQAGWLK